MSALGAAQRLDGDGEEDGPQGLKSGWSYKKLGDLGFIGRGKSKHRPRNDPTLYDGDYPFIQTGEIKATDLYISSYTQTYNDKGLKQSKLWDPGTLCITIAANIAETAILKIKACFPDSVVGFVANPKKSDVRFIKYYIDLIKLQMQNISKGTTQDNLSLDKLLSFDFLVPPLPTQRRIAAILSAYDDLIENNARRIAILEEMARNLYREWFVEFRFPGHEGVRVVDGVPEGWEKSKLGQIASINALSIGLGREPNTINYVDISSVSPGRIDKIEPMSFTDAPGRARRIVQHGDIIWSNVRPNRRSYSLILNPVPNLIVSTGFSVITANNVPYMYLYQALTTDDFVSYLVNRAKGSAYPAVGNEDFKIADIIVPNKGIAEKYHTIAFDLMMQCNVLAQKTTNLRHTRDLLLPKLISGELDVSDLDIVGAETTDTADHAHA